MNTSKAKSFRASMRSKTSNPFQTVLEKNTPTALGAVGAFFCFSASIRYERQNVSVQGLRQDSRGIAVVTCVVGFDLDVVESSVEKELPHGGALAVADFKKDAAAGF